ncbi:hypothetical protein N7462_002850 [Penicillium macrosclerotiorum]|uniref:uncharacterized protein n=1 Tax=Penicillium macrosclerotiorum TaxID=303699 RepID=UPI002549B74E|nr:uncharacterized protein N7462_002850 [Penicillium macrosclerotiorum]KAJ5693427.1 hypothetical protein N7462_002850 [Penicillium macrosclerotiorum]
MASRELPLSLLDAVRAQLTLDSDSDRSVSPVRKIVSIPERRPVRPLDDNPLASSTSTSGSFVYIDSTNDHEPFPDFDETLSEAYHECEQAYNEAVAAAMQEEILAKEVEPGLVAPPGQPETKKRTLDRIKTVLSNPQLRSSTRKRFIALCNMVIRLDHVLFRRSESFLGPQDTADAQEITTEMLSYISWVDALLQQLVETAGRVSYMLALIEEEEDAVVVRYRQMASVVAAHLRKPRFLEQRLLSLYLDLYDEWIHNRFLHMSNRQILQEDKIDPARLDLTRHLHSIWEILSRSIENYALYREALQEIRDEYFTPTMEEMPNAPDMEPGLAEEHHQEDSS